jgi:hypothetical protein
MVAPAPRGGAVASQPVSLAIGWIGSKSPVTVSRQ